MEERQRTSDAEVHNGEEDGGEMEGRAEGNGGGGGRREERGILM